MHQKNRKPPLPPFPDEIGHVWFAFVDLAATRDVGMGIGPISFKEIEAYQAQTHAMLTAWDVRLIRRLDVAVRAILSGGPTDKAIPASNGKAVRALFRGVAARKVQKGGLDEPR